MKSSKMPDAIPVGEKFRCENLSTGKVYRAIRESENQVFVFAPNKSRRGWRYSNYMFFTEYTPLTYTKEDLNASWHKRIAKALKIIKASGLWTDYVRPLENLSTMTYEDRKEIYALYNKAWTAYGHLTSEERRMRQVEDIKSKWSTKYPFIIKKDIEGREYVETWYLWEMSEVKLKSMYFGKYWNKEYKSKIKKSIEDKEMYSCTARTSYDVSFDYNPKVSQAWYSEEYRDCGNGHYYIALDHNTCWFCEND